MPDSYTGQTAVLRLTVAPAQKSYPGSTRQRGDDDERLRDFPGVLEAFGDLRGQRSSSLFAVSGMRLSVAASRSRQRGPRSSASS